MDIAFKQSGEQLKVNDTIMGARITPEQKKMLQNHEMVFVENMRYKGRVFSDDVRFSNKSNQLLIGRNAREYKPKLDEPKRANNKKPSRHPGMLLPLSLKARKIVFLSYSRQGTGLLNLYTRLSLWMSGIYLMYHLITP